MEEVWKDINPSSLNDHSNPNFILQDFFSGRPLGIDPPSKICSGHHTNSALLPPPTMLNMNSVPPGFESLDNPHHFKDPQNNTTANNAFVSPFCGLDSSSSPPCNFPSYGRKRAQDFNPNSSSSSSDRRHKRMIKNRESAARSRARKQAYTQELENAVNQLGEENARLRKQQEKLNMAAAPQLPKKHTLYRTSTAPF